MAKKKKKSVTQTPRRRKSRKPSTSKMVQYNAAGASPKNYVRGTVGAMAPATQRAKEMAKRKALEQTHTMTAVGAAAAIGYLEGANMLTSLPQIAGLSSVQLAAVGAFAASQFTKNKTVDHVSTGLLAAAGFEMAKKAGQESLGAMEAEEWD